MRVRRQQQLRRLERHRTELHAAHGHACDVRLGESRRLQVVLQDNSNDSVEHKLHVASISGASHVAEGGLIWRLALRLELGLPKLARVLEIVVTTV